MEIQTSIRQGTAKANFAPCPINPDWILEGNPVARIEILSRSEDTTANTCMWDCTAGRFNWFYGFDETLYILEGSAKLKDRSGNVRTIVPGDTVFFPRGAFAEWTVDEYIRKLAFCRFPIPSFLNVAKRVGRRLRGALRGGAASDGPPGMF